MGLPPGRRTGPPCGRRGATAGGPSSCGLAQGVHVGAAEEVGLHIHLLDVELARLDLLVHVLVAGVEAAGGPHMATRPVCFLQVHHRLAFAQDVAQRDFHLHVLARFQAGNGLAGVHLRGRAQDHGVHFLDGQAVGQPGGDVGMPYLSATSWVLARSRLMRETTSTPGCFDAVQVLDAEGACPASATLMVMG